MDKDISVQDVWEDVMLSVIEQICCLKHEK